MSSHKENTVTWNKIAQEYADKFMGLDLYNDTYDDFFKTIKKKHASILEIGCGPGNITQFIAKRSADFKIEAIDISENMIVLAKKNIPEANFHVMDCRNVAHLEMSFDAIVCGFTIPYLSEADCSKLLSDCCDLLKKNGTFYLSFVSGKGEDSGCIYGNQGDTLYFYYHDGQLIKRELERNGFIVINEFEKKYQKSEDSVERHTILFAKKTRNYN
ncbi:class I SAM-dependent DNA methyltransferase [Flagellimonas crocea]|uniref:class I SAM-dependent DNA methyltransferase n=1 Tax=Flagellimonas crocea TaxID=3067311 RepID=UPI00296E80AC|nr:class I SAM-dependent methyltransferase [Muricauda sp. DH64]